MVDPELTRLVGERLRLVLADQLPRRASAPPAEISEAPADEPDLPDLPPRPVFSRAHVGVVAVLLVVGCSVPDGRCSARGRSPWPARAA